MKKIFNKYYSNLLENKIIKNYNDDFSIFITLNSFILENKTIFLLLPNITLAAKYYEVIAEILPNNTLFFPLDDDITLYGSLISGNFSYERLNTINKLLFTSDNYIVIGTYNSILKYVDIKESLLKYNYNLRKGEDYPFNKLKEDLIVMGYRKGYLCDNVGTSSYKGSIIDFFPYNNINPIRLDFFDNTLETIKEFDVNTQISINSIDKYKIPINTEFIYSDKDLELIIKKLYDYFSDKKLSPLELEKLEEDIEKLKKRESLESLIIYSDILYDKKSSLFSYKDNVKVIQIGKEDYINTLKLKEEEKHFLIQELGGDSLTSLNYRFDLSYINNYDNLNISKEEKGNLNIRNINKEFSSPSSFLVYLKDDLKDYSLFTSFTNDKNKETFNNLLKDLNIENEINVLENVPTSFIDDTNKLIFINENLIFNISSKTKDIFKNYGAAITKIKTHEDITYDDYVVHYDHGIAKYKGLVALDTTGIKRDYLLLEYANNEKLYVPVEQIDLILKYHKDKATDVKLSRLGTKTWQNQKKKAKEKIKETYEELLALYNTRENTKGYTFYPNKELEDLLAKSFPYKETKDQENAIKDTLSDMEKEKPMERLICGDVGFGKTEVAIRAAFRAVLNGKQVALLSPTTILSKQHYETFKKRLSDFGVSIALLNRFVSPKEAKRVIEEIRKGTIDILIGTHRIIQNDINFKNLGLYIIDEEQRFGVIAKEKIRSMHIGVDTIFLSATPIPRTLQMSLSGIKDLSIIATPPDNRFPIQTYLLKRNYLIIRDAITKEITRGGQVFYLVSRIDEIKEIQEKLQSLLPNTTIRNITGRHDKEELNENLRDFIDGKVDILITTTIIENGIDIPNANTIIVHDSQMFGMSQLYQIKGRVGRSNKIAYCYLCYDSETLLTNDAKKRLDALKTFTALGSGYKIAMQDLLIRGSGEILGKEQSGFIDTLGFEVYLKLLEEELNPEEFHKKKYQKAPHYGTHLKPSYIEYEKIRIEIHKKINKIKNSNDLLNIEKELLDRFGKYDAELSLYLQENLYKVYEEKLEILKTEPRKGGVKLTFKLKDNPNLIYSNLLEEIIKLHLTPDFNIVQNNLIADISFNKDNRNFLYILNNLFLNYFINK